ncbi:DUF2336 domain-containing protein [Bradyrhizobium sp. ISRA443]|uniref:DUF2336 domain-containing protein n=1 Tax=unclassified Bradyrhizobium TaxID=2631580 RepID=UPI00247ABE93|nr:MULTISPECIES: DUF2336 domain-containing protein [unclassified Bradyrhizobium]WGR91327.1 DUF2336 domain-containing protein [Bradyrhizobium sp. ISRA435]WGS01558.1 DUF2336 domain-containing protein [Bradyrhizobium sp. ISRA436]WGS08445.1 DUF2336 domain-containing protein [Bradyrhizobium sp. ISRA437]WGS15333.1 DUF2336 domain-containing protein [Bradyrhizobium sp. ISRA443]
MSSKSATAPASLLDELQATLAHGPVARRVETLRRVTDLFISGSVDYSHEQIGLFDDVFQCLLEHIESSARALLANRLAPIDTAPPQTIRTLAFDDLIEVAGPVLAQSARVDDDTLIETARSKSQAHLLAISTRKALSGAVTDVLVLRGNDEVIQSTVNNPGAEFTERGFTRLVSRAEGDDNLSTCVGLHPSIPRHLYLKLVAKASDAVRQRLEAANPQHAKEIPIAVKEATRRARSAPAAVTRDTTIARALVKSLYEDGRLDEFQLAAFAEAGKFDETNASLAALANVTVGVAENMMIETRAEGVMILAKVSGLSWSTVRAIINLRDDISGGEPTDLQACKDTYERLRPSTAQQVLRFHRMQQSAPAA